MAVIREKRQFQNQRIGVVRMDTGAEDYYKTIANAADNLTSIAFKEAGRQAREKGIQSAEAVNQQGLRTINPETGKPQAYNVPSNFGTVAQAAYEEVLDRRFINDVDEQIKERGRELALKYQNDPKGVEKYSQAMEDYVAQMIKPDKNKAGLNDRFKNIIRDTGASFIASTKFNLMAKRAEVLQNQLRNGLIKDAEDAADQIASTVQAGQGFDVEYESGDVVSESTASLMVETAIAEQQAGFDSGILTEPQFRANVDAIYKSVPEGILNTRLNYDAMYTDNNGTVQRMNSDVALIIENAMDTGIVSKDLPQSLVPEVEAILKSEGYQRNKAAIQRKAGELRVALSNREREAKKLTQQQEAEVRILGNQKVNPRLAENKQAADNIITRRTPELANQQFPDLISYMLSDESKNNYAMMSMVHNQNLFPESLLTAFDLGSSLQTNFTAENYQTILTHYESFSDVNVLGSSSNKLKDVLSDKQHAFYRSLSALTKQQGSQNILSLVAKLDSAYDNPKDLQFAIGRALENPEQPNKELATFLGEAFPNDKRMQDMAKPLVEMMAFGGSNKKQIKRALLGMYESVYTDTKGIVIDRLNPTLGKSIFAPHALLGSSDVRKFYVNGQEYINSVTDGGYVLSENPVGIDSDKIVKLYPITQNSAQPELIEYSFTVKDGDKDVERSGSIGTYQYMAVTINDLGEIKPILDKETGIAVMFGTEIALDEIKQQRMLETQKEINYSNIVVEKRKQAKELLKSRTEGLGSAFGNP
jgi:hypothetical protein